MLLTISNFFTASKARRRHSHVISTPIELFESRTVLSSVGVDLLAAAAPEDSPVATDAAQDACATDAPVTEPIAADPPLPGAPDPAQGTVAITELGTSPLPNGNLTIGGATIGNAVTVVLSGAVNAQLTVNQNGGFSGVFPGDTNGLVAAIAYDANGNISDIVFLFM